MLVRALVVASAVPRISTKWYGLPASWTSTVTRGSRRRFAGHLRPIARLTAMCPFSGATHLMVNSIVPSGLRRDHGLVGLFEQLTDVGILTGCHDLWIPAR